MSMRDEFISFIKSRGPITLFLVSTNLIVFLVLSVLGDTRDALFMYKHGAAYYPAIVEGKEYYRIFTNMFLHFGIEHLLYNMLMLIFMGDIVEKLYGKIQFLLIYLIGGVGGNLLSLFFSYRSKTYAVEAGASGAIFAVVGGLVVSVLVHRHVRESVFGRRTIFMAILLLAEGFTQKGIGNAAHAGGFLTGLLIAFLFYVSNCFFLKKR